jgi:hypothetical protein
MNQETGYFIFSLDTELAWGYFWDSPESDKKTWDGGKIREAIQHLLEMMDEFGVVATWAVTGHLFYEKCEECELCPIMELKDKDPRFNQIWGTQDPRWYGADIIESILSKNSGHEICFHGYSHKLIANLSSEEARFEIQEWLRLAKRKGIQGQSVIFPQGRIGHLDLFRDAGFICYRGYDVAHPALSIPVLGKILNQINLRLSLLTPQVYEINPDVQGLVNVPSSQWLFRTNRTVETMLDLINLPYARLTPTVRSIRNAAEEKKVVHLWAHPHEFRTNKDLDKLRFIFEHFAKFSRAGKLQSITMSDMVKKTWKSSYHPPK